MRGSAGGEGCTLVVMVMLAMKAKAGRCRVPRPAGTSWASGSAGREGCTVAVMVMRGMKAKVGAF